MGAQEAIVRIQATAVPLELVDAASVCLPDVLRSQQRCLIEQGERTVSATELIVLVEERQPLGPAAGGDRIEAHHLPVVCVREQ